MTFEETLNKLYRQNKGKSSFKKSEILYLIIQIKSENKALLDFNSSLYLDIKKFIKNYIKTADKKDYGYDKIDLNKIIKAISVVTDPQFQKYTVL